MATPPRCVVGTFLEVAEILKFREFPIFSSSNICQLKASGAKNTKSKKVKTLFASILIPSCVLSKNDKSECLKTQVQSIMNITILF